MIVFRAWFEIEVGSHAGLVYASNAASRQVKELDSIVLDRIDYRNRDEEVVARIFWLVAFGRYPFPSGVTEKRSNRLQLVVRKPPACFEKILAPLCGERRNARGI